MEPALRFRWPHIGGLLHYIIMSNLASNLTSMYVDLNQTMAAMSNASSGNTMTIPKRIPIDSAEWFKTFGRQFMDSEVQYEYINPNLFGMVQKWARL